VSAVKCAQKINTGTTAVRKINVRKINVRKINAGMIGAGRHGPMAADAL
jgi:hypothetical protein